MPASEETTARAMCLSTNGWRLFRNKAKNFDSQPTNLIRHLCLVETFLWAPSRFSNLSLISLVIPSIDSSKSNYSFAIRADQRLFLTEIVKLFRLPFFPVYYPLLHDIRHCSRLFQEIQQPFIALTGMRDHQLVMAQFMAQLHLCAISEVFLARQMAQTVSARNSNNIIGIFLSCLKYAPAGPGSFNYAFPRAQIKSVLRYRTSKNQRKYQTLPVGQT